MQMPAQGLVCLHDNSKGPYWGIRKPSATQSLVPVRDSGSCTAMGPASSIALSTCACKAPEPRSSARLAQYLVHLTQHLHLHLHLYARGPCARCSYPVEHTTQMASTCDQASERSTAPSMQVVKHREL